MAASQLTAVAYDNVTAQVVAASPGAAANATDGNLCPNGGNSFLTMNNTGGSSYFVDVYPQLTIDGLTVTPRRHTVAAGVIKRVKLGSVSTYGNNVLVKAENAAVKLLVES